MKVLEKAKTRGQLSARGSMSIYKSERACNSTAPNNACTDEVGSQGRRMLLYEPSSIEQQEDTAFAKVCEALRKVV
jgi:hypothetical protein